MRECEAAVTTGLVSRERQGWPEEVLLSMQCQRRSKEFAVEEDTRGCKKTRRERRETLGFREA